MIASKKSGTYSGRKRLSIQH